MAIFPAPQRAERFIPEIWSAGIFYALRGELVVASGLVCNHDYEGQIQDAGDKVRIPTVLDPTVEDYDPIAGFTGDPQDIIGGETSFEIEESKAFRFKVDDIAKVQSLIGGQYMSEGMTRAARRLAEAADAYVAGKILAASVAYKKVDLLLDAAPDVMWQQLVDVRVALDKTNTPATGRYMIVSPELYGNLLMNPRFIDASQSGSTEPLRNGLVGRALGFDVVVANTLPAKTHAIAGHKIATSYADQIVKTEAYRPERWFADAIRGLHVYGARVMRGEHLAVLQTA
ncbi:P22 phage major capsid protein family protein [Nonomuraea sp. NPDC023979]|uniref:P22 phage major capsid protein family protein n=1 Tax=Nonomuraea sp. NPDC023979 TaxID=3154796 RepID=UPI0033E4B230